MPNLSASQLTQMRSQREASLQDTCALTPAVPDGDTPVTTTVACAVTPEQQGDDGGGVNQLTRRPRYAVSFPWGTVIATKDRFTWKGRTLEIGRVKEPTTFAMAVHGDCIEVG